MKRMLLCIALISVWVLLSAHPATDVKLNYDSKTKILAVSFNHPVKNADDHFIYEIEVKVNKKEVVKQTIKGQETLQGGEYLYKMIDLKPGDEVKVTTDCNKTGKKSAELIIK